MSYAQKIAEAFGSPKKAANGYLCKCCVCRKPLALAITDEPSRIGPVSSPVSFNCISGCLEGDIYFIANQLDLFKAPPKPEQQIEAMFGDSWLEEPVQAPDPLLDGLFDRGDKIALIGQSKTRKSFFALQLAIKLAAGQRVFGFDPPGPLKVLLIQYEIKAARYHQRAVKLAKGLNIAPESLGNLLVINMRGINLDPVEVVFNQAKIHKPDLIILDPLYKLIVGDESKIEEVKPILKQFDRLAEQSGAGVLYVHHDKKGLTGDSQLTDRGAGSGVLARDFDTAIFLSPHKDQEDTLVVEFITRNYAPPKSIALEWKNYSFTNSNASLEKKTARNQAQKKGKNSDFVEIARKLVADSAKFGVFEMGISIFNSKLEDLGVRSRSLGAVRAQLIADGEIEIESKKAKKGEPSKTVHFLNRADWVESGKTEFQNGVEEYSDELF